MTIYLDLVMVFNFVVDYLLLVGTNRLAGYSGQLGRAALSAGLGGLYAGACLLPGFSFLGNLLWRTVSLALMGILAFGFDGSTFRRCVLFILLSFSLGGIALGIGSGSFMALIGAAVTLCLLCQFGFRGKVDAKRYFPVELHHNGVCLRMTALHDTGNSLRDPLTGERVLICGTNAAWRLLKLNGTELSNPMETMISSKIHGLRLIPYCAVGNQHGMLLGLRPDRVFVGGKQQAMVIAFAPEGLDEAGGEYQALIGGLV